MIAVASALIPVSTSAQVEHAAGRILRVGPGEPFPLPSAAAAAAREGDRVVIAPGQYRDCAVWRVPRVTIEAAPGGEVEIHGPICAGKALFVASAPGLVVAGLTFRGARATEGNGAGIRAEGGDLTVRASRFIDNENGILTHRDPTAKLLVEDSVFQGNGALRNGRDCAHGIYVGQWARVTIRRSEFRDTQACHHIKSRALRTEILQSFIEDGPQGRSSYLIDIPSGGDLILRGSRLIKGPLTGNPVGAVVIGSERTLNPTRELLIEDNDFENRMTSVTAFVVNRGEVPAVLNGNRLSGPTRPFLGAGRLR
ncbi:MAG: hypothetical protein Q7J52_01905 [Falsiroseomonas sp.]|nr:hypothetical protein [Falsiroseomonas sp.]